MGKGEGGRGNRDSLMKEREKRKVGSKVDGEGDREKGLGKGGERGEER